MVFASALSGRMESNPAGVYLVGLRFMPQSQLGSPVCRCVLPLLPAELLILCVCVCVCVCVECAYVCRGMQIILG